MNLNRVNHKIFQFNSNFILKFITINNFNSFSHLPRIRSVNHSKVSYNSLNNQKIFFQLLSTEKSHRIVSFLNIKSQKFPPALSGIFSAAQPSTHLTATSSENKKNSLSEYKIYFNCRYQSSRRSSKRFHTITSFQNKSSPLPRSSSLRSDISPR